MLGGLQQFCFFCNGVIIGSQLVVYGSKAGTIDNGKYNGHFAAYNLIESDEPFQPRIHSGQDLSSFGMKDPIFFLADGNFPSFSCQVGFRVENDVCVDINECEILRHYCDFERNRSN